MSRIVTPAALLPTQEQVTILSEQEKRLTVPTIVPPFSALRRVQDKISAFRTLAEIGAPQPPTVEVRDVADLGRVKNFPVFVKRRSARRVRACDARARPMSRRGQRSLSRVRRNDRAN